MKRRYILDPKFKKKSMFRTIISVNLNILNGPENVTNVLQWCRVIYNLESPVYVPLSWYTINSRHPLHLYL